MKFLTSMSQEGYELYGKTFLSKAVDCLPGELTVYSEDNYETMAKDHPKVEFKDLNQVSGFKWFIDSVGRFPIMQGRLDERTPRIYQLDIHRFCRKSFAQLDFAADHQEPMWWIDSDVEFRKPIPLDFFERNLKGVFMAYMGRPSWHSCASLVGFNNTHKQAAEFWASYMHLYMSGAVFTLKEWHDSFILDYLRDNLSFLTRNLSAGIELGEGPVNVFDAVLGEYAHHKKGNLKHQEKPKERRLGPNRYAQLIDLVAEKQPALIMEVGTWNGNRAMEMHMVAPRAHYVGFDLFESATAETDEKEKNVKPHHTAASVAMALEKQGVSHQLFGGDSKETLPMYLNRYGAKSADFIFIDGGHSVETIKSDLTYCLEAIKEGRTIVMDDWYEGMPDEELAKFGCNAVLKELGLDYRLLPIADPVKGGGTVKMAVIQC